MGTRIAEIMEQEFEYSNELFDLIDIYSGKVCESEVWDNIESKSVSIREKYRNKISTKNLNKIYDDFNSELFFNRFHSAISMLQERFSKSSTLDELYTYKDITNSLYKKHKDKINLNDDKIQYLYRVTNFMYQSNKLRILGTLKEE